MSLDMRTAVFFGIMINLSCTLFIVQLWRQNRRRFAGLDFWVFNFVMQTAALALIILRGTISDWISIVLANILIIAGIIAVYIGLERFLDKKSTHIHNYLMLICFTGVHTYFTFAHPAMAVRSLNVSLGVLFISFQCCWLLFRRVGSDLRPLAFSVGMVFGGYCVVSIFRIIEYFVGAHSEGDYFHSSSFQTLTLVLFQVLIILLTYSLVMMVNKRLIMEIGIQEEKYRTILETMEEGLVESDLKGNCIYVNDAACKLFGYDRDEMIGMSYKKRSTPETSRRLYEVFHRIYETGKPELLFDYEVIYKDGSIRIFQSNSQLLLDALGQPIGFRDLVRDVTDSKQAEEELKKNRDQLSKTLAERTDSLKEKELLLKEIHHRVKNNMQIIASLITMKSEKIKDPEATKILKDSLARIYTMALIHERLYNSENFAWIDFNDFINLLCIELFTMYNIDRQKIDYSVKIADVYLGIDKAIPFGLVMNEIITNCLKHAFPGDYTGIGMIRISMNANNGTLETIISDNGIGIPEQPEFKKSDSTGLSLVHLIVEKQLQGSIKLSREKGTTHIVRIPVEEGLSMKKLSGTIVI